MSSLLDVASNEEEGDIVKYNPEESKQTRNIKNLVHSKSGQNPTQRSGVGEIEGPTKEHRTINVSSSMIMSSKNKQAFITEVNHQQQ